LISGCHPQNIEYNIFDKYWLVLHAPFFSKKGPSLIDRGVVDAVLLFLDDRISFRLQDKGIQSGLASSFDLINLVLALRDRNPAARYLGFRWFAVQIIWHPLNKEIFWRAQNFWEKNKKCKIIYGPIN
jgi:hypothetical protein